MRLKRIHYTIFTLCMISVMPIYAQPSWTVNAGSYEYNMTFTGVVSINDTLVENTPGVMVGAFNENSECVGTATARYYGSVKKYRVPIMIYSNQEGEILHLKAYVPGQGAEFDISTSIEFENDGGEGNFGVPVVWMEDPTTSCERSFFSFSVFPNPVNERLTIHFQNQGEVYKIVLLNLSGVVLKEIIAYDTNEIFDISAIDSGTYLLRVEGEDDVLVKKIVKE